MITKPTSNIENFLSQKELKDVISKVNNIEQQLGQFGSQLNNGTLTVSGLTVTNSVTLPTNSVNGSQIIDNTISTQKLVDGQVTSQKIQQLTNDLIFSNTVSGKGIYWNSKNNPDGGDYQFIRYYQDASEFTSTNYDISSSSSENGTLIIGVENDLSSGVGDQVVIRTGQRLIIDQNGSTQSTQDPINIVEFWQEGVQKAKIDPNGVLTVNGLNVTSNTVTFNNNSINGSWIIDYSIPTTKISNTGTLTVNGLNVTSTTVTFQPNSINGDWIINNTISTQKLVDGQVTSQKITSGQVNTQQIADLQVITNKIADGQVTSQKITNNQILTQHINNNQVTSEKIAANQITSQHINNNQIQTQHINNNQVTSDKIQQLTNDLIFSNTVTGKGIYWWNKNNPGVDYQFIRYYQDDSDYLNTYYISSSTNNTNNGTLVIGVESGVDNTSGEQIVIRTGQRLIIDQNATGQSQNQNPINIVEFWQKGVQKAKIDPNGILTVYGLNVTSNTVTFNTNSINGYQIIDNTIPTTKISTSGTLTVSGLNVTSTTVTFQNNSISGNQIINNTISTSKLVDGQVTTQKLYDAQVTTNKIADYQVTSQKIANNQITTQHIVDGQIISSKIANNQITSQHITNNQILTQHINNNQVTVDKLATNQVTSDKILDGQVTTSKLATGQVTSQKIQQLTDDLIFSNTVSGKGIYWNSKNNPGSDYQFIRYYQDAGEYTTTNYDISGGNTENGMLIIGVENDLNSPSADQVVIRTGSRLIIDQNGTTNTTQDPINIVEFWQEGTQKARIDKDGNIYGNKVYNAVWNDFAELREQETTIEPGYVQFMNEQTGKLTKKYHKYAVGIVSDTYGIVLGVDSKSKKIKKGQVPIQVQGRVLQYFSGKLKVGDQVCQQKDGTVRKMKWWEKIFFPEKMLGIVDEIPTYETWGEDNVKVNGRIWIRVK